MGLKQYLGFNNNVLVKQLKNILSSENSIFAPTFICIGHSSTKDWLIDELLIQGMDIVGNCVFQKQYELVDMIHKTLIGKTERKERFHTDHLQWFIYSVLRLSDFRTKFPEISSYYEDDALMRFTLAEKITHLFEVYQEQAIDLSTSTIVDFDNNSHFYWQKYIWNELQNLTGDQFTSLLTVYSEINEALKIEENQKLLKSKIPNIHLYGDLNYTEEFVHFLKLISNYSQVSIFRVDFSNEQNNSRFVKNNFSFSQKNKDLLSGVDVVSVDDEVNQFEESLLGKLKVEIENSTSNLKYTSSEEDDSVTIANCFTEYREVEALWHFLVNQFDKNKNLAQRDVCVVVPNIEKYAPAIKAIFKNEKLAMNYTFYDSSSKIQDSPYKALLALYDFDGSEFTSKQVFSLLEFKYIREKFGFTEDLSIIKKAIDDASIFHSYEGNENIDTQFVSWKYGLKRLIVGSCIEKTDEKLNLFDEDFYPVSEFEDQSLYELIKLYHFVESLNTFVTEKSSEKTLEEWYLSIKATIDYFLNVSDYEPSNFDKKLEQLVKSSKVLPDEKIEFKVIHYYLKELFENEDLSTRIGFGGIRFVSPNPFMVTSFKINCFLGLNGNDFPQTFKKISFDLRNEKQITTKNELDKHLFLSLVQGAKEKLYISYIGQNSKNNSVIPASTLVEDLLAVFKKWDIKNEELIINHPLHSFSGKYNSSNFKNLIRYDLDIEKQSTLHKAINTDVEKFFTYNKKGQIVIQLTDLIKFTEDPIKHYYNKVLGIYYSDKSIDLDECEMFELGYLEKWSVKNTLLKKRLDSDLNEEELFQRLKMIGQFPLKNIGSSFQIEISKEVNQLIYSVEEQVDLNNKKLEILSKKSIEINDKYEIVGSVDSIYDDKFLFATVSSDKWKYQLRAVIQFLFATKKSENHISSGVYVTRNAIKNIFVDQDNLDKFLLSLCDLYAEGSVNMIHFSGEVGNEIDFDSQNVNLEDYMKTITKLLNDSYVNVYPSDYFLKEWNNGSMENENSKRNFIDFNIKIKEILTNTLSEQ